MTFYKVILKPSVEKDFRGLPRPVIQRITTRIEALADDPVPHGSVKLTGAENLYRLRVGDYRVIFGVDHDARSVTVHHIRHRREAYRSL